MSWVTGLPGLIAQAGQAPPERSGIVLRLSNHTSIMIKSAVRFGPVPAGQKLTADGLAEMAMRLAGAQGTPASRRCSGLMMREFLQAAPERAVPLERGAQFLGVRAGPLPV